MSSGSRFLALGVLVLAAACGGPSRPSTVGYAGQWAGTTSQGMPIAFRVSADQTLTTLTVGYHDSGCSGTATFTPNVAITGIPTAPIPVGSAAFESGPVGLPNRVLATFLFTSSTDAHGLLIFADFEGCAASLINAPWTATKR
jgi:hypothetical protein